MKSIINRFAEENSIIYGVCDGGRLTVRDEQILLDAPFIQRDINRRLDPNIALSGTKSVIVIGLGHNPVSWRPPDSLQRGRISSHAIGRDYHEAVYEILERLAAELGKARRFRYKIFVDRNALCERALAVKAGLGYVGKNQAVISKKFGSYFNIGIMLTDLDLEPDIANYGQCPDACTLCIKACPGGALSEKGFDYRKCVSYLTQKKGQLEQSEISKLGNWIYGCDTCQEVCPENNKLTPDISSSDLAWPVLDELILMDDNEFVRRFGGTALFWRGRETIIRNAKHAKRNV